MNKSNKVWFLLLLIKIILAIWIPLFADEAYYWVWSARPQLAYYDHPGMISWLFYLGTIISDSFQLYRIPGVILGHLSIWIWFDLLKSHIKEEHHSLYILGLSLIPLSGLGLLIMTPDLPLVFFWSVALWSFLQLLELQKVKYYLLLGAALGLGACSKYHIILFPVAAFIYMWRENKFNKINWTYFSVCIFMALLFSSPTWIWNLKNDFVSFRFQLAHGLQKKSAVGSWTLRYIWDQILLIFPPIVILAIKSRPGRDLAWIKYFAMTPLIFFFFTSLRGPVEANWPAVGHPAVFSLAFLSSKSNLQWVRLTITAWFIALNILLGQIAFGFLPKSSLTRKLDEVYTYKEVIAAAKEPLPIFTHTYQMASLMSYYLKNPFFKLRGVGRRDYFDYLPESQPTQKKFYWLANNITPLPDWAIGAGYKISETIPVNDSLILNLVEIP